MITPILGMLQSAFPVEEVRTGTSCPLKNDIYIVCQGEGIWYTITFHEGTCTKLEEFSDSDGAMNAFMRKYLTGLQDLRRYRERNQ